MAHSEGIDRLYRQWLGAKEIPRRPLAGAPPAPTGPRANERIRVPQVRLIGPEGENIGVVTTDEARDIAVKAGLDLVEVSPNADPPVCKVLDLGKYKYEAQKKANQARKNQKTQDIKEIKMRPGIDVHEYQVKMRSANKFIEAGDKVKFTLRFKGREMAHQNLGMDVLRRVEADLEGIAKIEARPKMEGRQMIMVASPK